MAKPIFTALSPNAQVDDIILALKLLFKPWLWQKGDANIMLEKMFKQRFGFKHVFFFESGRTCLYGVLKSLGLRNGDEVLIQAYTCVAVPEPVLWNGLVPVYVDCEENSLTMSLDDLKKKITPRSKVLIVQHTFGNPANLDQLIEFAKKNGLFVIEDCAHALGSKYKGKFVGTFGDAAFSSFGRDKVISSVFGGVLMTNSDKIAAGIKDYYNNVKDSARCWIFQQIIHPLIIALVKFFYGVFIGRALLMVAKKIGLISKAVYKEEKQGLRPSFIGCRLPNAMALMAIRQLSKLDQFNQHRRDLARYYSASLKDLKLARQHETKNGKSIFLRYVLRLDDPKTVLKKAAAANIYLGDWYNTAIAPDGVNYGKINYNPRYCPVAEKVASQTINLPTDINTSLSAAARVVQFLKHYYGIDN